MYELTTGLPKGIFNEWPLEVLQTKIPNRPETPIQKNKGL